MAGLMSAAIPSKAKLAFLDSELGIFFHFGVRTFTE